MEHNQPPPLHEGEDGVEKLYTIETLPLSIDYIRNAPINALISALKENAQHGKLPSPTTFIDLVARNSAERISVRSEARERFIKYEQNLPQNPDLVMGGSIRVPTEFTFFMNASREIIPREALTFSDTTLPQIPDLADSVSLELAQPLVLRKGTSLEKQLCDLFDIYPDIPVKKDIFFSLLDNIRCSHDVNSSMYDTQKDTEELIFEANDIQTVQQRFAWAIEYARKNGLKFTPDTILHNINRNKLDPFIQQFNPIFSRHFMMEYLSEYQFGKEEYLRDYSDEYGKLENYEHRTGIQKYLGKQIEKYGPVQCLNIIRTNCIAFVQDIRNSGRMDPEYDNTILDRLSDQEVFNYLQYLIQHENDDELHVPFLLPHFNSWDIKPLIDLYHYLTEHTTDSYTQIPLGLSSVYEKKDDKGESIFKNEYLFNDIQADEQALQNVALDKQGITLELGSGLGRITEKLKEHGCENVIGVDLDYQNIEESKRSAQEKGIDIHYIHADWETAGIGNSSIDTVILMGRSVTHTEDEVGFQSLFRQVFTYLKKGGKALFDAPNPNGSVMKQRREELGNHVYELTKQTSDRQQFLDNFHYIVDGPRPIFEQQEDGSEKIIGYKEVYNRFIPSFELMQRLLREVGFTLRQVRNNDGEIIKGKIYPHTDDENLYFVAEKLEAATPLPGELAPQLPSTPTPKPPASF